VQVVEKSREAREELASFRRRQQEGGEAAEGGDQPMASPGPRASKRTGSGRKAKKPQSERLADAAADNVTQLRLACIHPQVLGLLLRGELGPLLRCCLLACIHRAAPIQYQPAWCGPVPDTCL
jgi:hypothetical protein